MTPDQSGTWTERGTGLAVLAVLLAVGSLAGAWYFQYVAGYQPCKLCLLQRWPYYLGIPAGVVALVAYAYGLNRLGSVLLALFIIAFLVGSGLGVYHAGVEWKLWAGPTDCGGSLSAAPASIEDFRKSLATTKVIRCDEAPLRILGLSFAGWNAVISLVIAGLAARAFRR